MTATTQIPTPTLAAPRAAMGLTPYELAELAREDAAADWREAMAELAMHNRAFSDGDWTLDDWIEWSPVGRGEVAAYARSTAGMGK